MKFNWRVLAAGLLLIAGLAVFLLPAGRVAETPAPAPQAAPAAAPGLADVPAPVAVSAQAQQVAKMPPPAPAAQPIVHVSPRTLEPLRQSDPRIRASILSRQPIEVAWPALEQLRDAGGGQLTFPRGEEGPVQVDVTQVVPNAGGGYTLVGKVQGYPAAEFIATAHADAFIADLRMGNLADRDYSIRLTAPGQHELRGVNHAILPACDGIAVPKLAANSVVPKAAQDIGGKVATATVSPAVAAEASAVPDDGSVIDVMIVYTPKARTNFGGVSAMIAGMNQAVQETNIAFADSLVTTRFRLSHFEEINYIESTDGGTDLTYVRQNGDGIMDEVHPMRNTYAADLVSLWVDGESAGVGYLLSSLDPGFESAAFNVCDIDYAVGNYTFAHECGHNMGCHHDAPNAGSAIYPYSYGWRWRGTGGTEFRTIMAYPPGIRIRYYSNPLVTANGGTTGSAASADNARTINNTRVTVSSFRASPSLSISPSAQTVPSTGGTFDFSINSQRTWNWTVSGGLGWLTIDEATTQSGNQSFTYTASANGSPTTRTATITISDSSTSRTHTITQGGTAPVLSNVPNIASFSAEGGDRNINITANVSWSWFINQTWVSATDEPAAQTGDQTFSYFVQPNITANTRTATINFSSPSGLTTTHTIFQAGVVNDDHGRDPSTASLVGLNATTPGRFETPGDVDFFRVEVTQSGTLIVESTGILDTLGFLLNAAGNELTSNDDDGVGSNFRISYAVTPGTYYARVRHYDDIATGNYELVTRFSSATLSTGPLMVSVPAGAGTYSFNVTASEGWNWSVNQTWASALNEPATQTGSQTFEYTLTANPTALARTATFTLTSGILTAFHSVTQAGTNLPDFIDPRDFHAVSPATVAPGGTLQIGGDVKNQGAAASGAYIIRFYLSNDTTVTPQDLVIGEKAMPALAAGASAVIDTDGLLVPTTIPAGTYYIGWIYDADNTVAEASEVNNAVCLADQPILVSAALLGIKAGPFFNPANGHIYFLLNTASWTTSQAKALSLGGHLATINDAAEQSFIMANAGAHGAVWIGYSDAAAEGSFAWASGETPDYTNFSASEPSNGAGESYVLVLGAASGAEAGRWNDSIDASELSPYGLVELTDPANLKFQKPNGWSSEVVISAVSGTSVDGSSLLANDTLYLDFAPLNAGTGGVLQPWQIRVLVDDEERLVLSQPAGLAAGAGTELLDQAIGSLSAGAHTIRVVLDANAEIAESNEEDNAFVRTINVNPALNAPIIATHPASVSVNPGQTTVLTVAATGSTLAYQWYQGASGDVSTPIASATAASFTAPAVSATTSYWVKVSNPAGMANSRTATVSVNTPLQMALDGAGLVWATGGHSPWQQQTAVTHDGADAAQSGKIDHSQTTWVETQVTGPGALSFWWKVSSESGSRGVLYDKLTFTVNGVAPAAVPAIGGDINWKQVQFVVPAGPQTLRWTYTKDAGTSARLDAAWLDEVAYQPQYPQITAQPQSQGVALGGSCTFTVAANGIAPLSYQWLKEGAPIPGATSASYSIAVATLAHAGAYSVKVTNPAGESTSDPAQLVVNLPPGHPAITVQPVSQAVVLGGTIRFAITATGAPTLTYQWFRNDAAISGATGATYTAGNAQLSAAGTYRVVVSNFLGNVSSQAATVQIALPAGYPAITVPPVAKKVDPGQSATFSVSASGTATLQYQWLKNGQPIANATTASYTKSNVQVSDDGIYSVRVKNAIGEVISDGVRLTVTLPANLAAMPYDGTWSDGLVITKSTISTVDAASFTGADTVALAVAFRNLGEIATVGTIHCSIVINPGNRVINFSHNAAIPPGAGVKFVNLPILTLGQLIPGTYTIALRLDTTNVVAERLESDNTYQKTITVVPAPPLTLPVPSGVIAQASTVDGALGIDVKWTAGSAEWGAFALQRRSTNKAGRFGSWTALAKPSGPTYRDADVVSGRGYSYRVQATNGTFTSKLSAPSARIDVLASAPPQNSSNLVGVKPQDWQNSIILSNAQGAWNGSLKTDGQLVAGSRVYASLVMSNSGTQAVNQPFRVALIIDGQTLATASSSTPTSIAANGTYVFRDIDLGILPPGQHTVSAELDARGEILESNEADNVMTRGFFIDAPSPELKQLADAGLGWAAPIVVSTQTGANTSGSAFTSDDPLYVSVGIANAGAALPADRTFEVTLYLDGVPLATPAAQTITSGGDFAWILRDLSLPKQPVGKHVFSVRIDDDNLVFEGNEADNLVSKHFEVKAPVLAPPGLPTALAATVQATPTVAARLTWTTSGTGGLPTAHVVQRREKKGARWLAWTTINADTGSGAAAFNDPAVVAGKSYQYRVQAKNSFGASKWSKASPTLAVP